MRTLGRLPDGDGPPPSSPSSRLEEDRLRSFASSTALPGSSARANAGQYCFNLGCHPSTVPFCARRPPQLHHLFRSSAHFQLPSPASRSPAESARPLQHPQHLATLVRLVPPAPLEPPLAQAHLAPRPRPARLTSVSASPLARYASHAMSTPAEPFWPQVGSVWQHWSDLVVATQLAAARSGFVGLSRYWDARSASQVLVRCQSGTSRQDKRCYNTLVRSAACDLARPDGAYRVSHLYTEFCDAQRHPLHLTSSGLSTELKDPLEALALSPGDELTGHRALHSLEAAARAHARREGRFIAVTHDQAQGFAAVNLCCVLGTARCPFLLRLQVLEPAADGFPRWRCIEIRAGHTCISEARAVEPELEARLSFFPQLELSSGSSGRRSRLRETLRDITFVTQRDQCIGYYPVREAGTEAKVHVPVFPLHTASSSTKSRPSGSASSSAAKFPIPSGLTELAHAVKKVRKVVLKEVEQLERQKEKLEEMTDEREIEEASSVLVTASRTFTSTSCAHLEALTAALQDRLKVRDLKQWKEQQLENRMQELIDELL